MKILITGAGGNLGRAIVPALLEKGHQPRLMDFRPMKTDCEFRLGNVDDPADVLSAAEGMDAIVHGAALHGIHLSSHGAGEFWSVNVTGTHNVFQAAVRHGISKVVFCSTADVYGAGLSSAGGAYREVTESTPTLPVHPYGFTKLMGEQMCRYYGRVHAMKVIGLRLGIFLPESFVRYGFRLLKGGVDDRDVAQAFVLAIENQTIQCDMFNIMSRVPFTREDEKALAEDPMSVLEKYHPGCRAICAAKDVPPDIFRSTCSWWGNNYWSVEKAARDLGYTPRHDFGRFLKALAAGDLGYYACADLPTWRGGKS